MFFFINKGSGYQQSDNLTYRIPQKGSTKKVATLFQDVDNVPPQIFQLPHFFFLNLFLGTQFCCFYVYVHQSIMIIIIIVINICQRCFCPALSKIGWSARITEPSIYRIIYTHTYIYIRIHIYIHIYIYIHMMTKVDCTVPVCAAQVNGSWVWLV